MQMDIIFASGYHRHTEENELTHWPLVTPWIWVNIGSGNGLLPDGTKPSPEPVLTYDQ